MPPPKQEVHTHYQCQPRGGTYHSRHMNKSATKTLFDGSVDGKGWVLAQQHQKANWLIEQQDTWKQQQQQKQWIG